MEHPLYIKYSNSTYGDITAANVKADLRLVLATAETAEVVFYLSSLLRVLELVA